MIWTNDPEKDADRFDAELERNLADCPVCDICGEPIQEYGYVLFDAWVCEDCMVSFKRRVY